MKRTIIHGDWEFCPPSTWALWAGFFYVEVYFGIESWIVDIDCYGHFVERLFRNTRLEAMQAAINWLTNELEQLQEDLNITTEIEEEEINE